MRSSPKFLVVNRSEGAPEEPDSRLSEDSVLFRTAQGSHRDEPEFNEIHLSLRISYKTILLAFMVFNIGNRLIGALF
jgi:hypothetical protein